MWMEASLKYSIDTLKTNGSPEGASPLVGFLGTKSLILGACLEGVAVDELLGS